MTTSQKSVSDDQTTTETTLDQFSTSQNDDEPDVATDGGQDVEQNDDQDDVEPIKISWDNDARNKFKSRKLRARLNDGDEKGELAFATLDRLKTRVVVETQAEADALLDLVENMRRAGYSWQTKQHTKSFARVRDELADAMADRGWSDQDDEQDVDETADDQDDSDTIEYRFACSKCQNDFIDTDADARCPDCGSKHPDNLGFLGDVDLAERLESAVEAGELDVDPSRVDPITAREMLADLDDQDDDGRDDQDDDQPAAEFVGAPEGRATGFRYETPDGDAVEIRKTGRESARVLSGAENLTDPVREAIARDRGILNFDTDADAVAADGGDDADQADDPRDESDGQQRDDQDEPEVEPAGVATEPTEPDVAQYILDGLDRQDPTELREIAEYADALADYRDAQIEAEAPTPDDPDRLADAVDELDQVDSSDDEHQQQRQELLFDAWDAGGTVQRKKIPCGDDCDGCPHGPYLYLTYRDGDTVRSKYLGQPGNYGVASQQPADADDQDDSEADDEPSTESLDLAEFVDEWDDPQVATDGGWSHLHKETAENAGEPEDMTFQELHGTAPPCDNCGRREAVDGPLCEQCREDLHGAGSE